MTYEEERVIRLSDNGEIMMLIFLNKTPHNILDCIQEVDLG